ncbi:MAG: tRNA pseudouridine(13) synthase TruD, partial [Planctomycetaceae bacterium]|nr:tRNA pseudouridine(13) synthase TruD [Planctomycetaceae bacterium]
PDANAFRLTNSTASSQIQRSPVKLKQHPEDFIVTEQVTLDTGRGGFAVYRLTKWELGTPEALTAISHCWNIPRQRIAHAGLKDRKAVTTQYITVKEGPHRDLTLQNLELEYIGQRRTPLTAADIAANHFELTVRDLTEDEVTTAENRIRELSISGIPNYFDDQRFGSLGESGEWVAHALCQGNYERALWLALADSHPGDSSLEKRQKQILKEHWGDWLKCKALLDRSHRRSIVTFLADKVAANKPVDFKGAFACLNGELRGLYLSAWQSALWNRLLTAVLQQELPAAQLTVIPLKSGPAVFPQRSVADALSSSGIAISQDDSSSTSSDAVDALRLRPGLQLPLPSARIQMPTGILGELLTNVLTEEGITLSEMKVRFPRDRFFSRGLRTALVYPDLDEIASFDDEHNPGRKAIRLSFALQRGSYATMMIRFLFRAANGDGLATSGMSDSDDDLP